MKTNITTTVVIILTASALFSILLGCFSVYIVNRNIEAYALKSEPDFAVQEEGAAQIVGIKQTNRFYNNCPVFRLALAVVAQDREYAVEDHHETIQHIAIGHYKLDVYYKVLLGEKSSDIFFIKDDQGFPIPM